MAPMHALLFLIFLLPLWGTHAQAQVYRCGNAYSDAPCPNGRAVDVSPQVSDPGGPRTTLIYLCRQPGNKRLLWNAAPCHASAMALERSERVPAHLDWAEQVAFANRLYAQAQATTAAAETGQVHAGRQSDPPRNSGRQAQCQALEARVRQLDSMGRAGSQHYDLDWIRSERKKTRDGQFRLQCR